MNSHQDQLQHLRAAIGEVIVGYATPIELILTALLSGGHVLIEDVPGVGKTLLARTVAHVSGLGFKRIQFTPDLLPSDVTGVNVFHPGDGAFHFQKGPIFTHFLLADELNRATPRTQSALLESMQERQVSVAGISHPLPRPFLTMATQNPIDMAGTFPLPSAQLDRFLMRIRLGYPEESEELTIVQRFSDMTGPEERVDPVSSPEEIQRMIHASREVFLSEDLQRYIVSIVRATRETTAIELGASPRSAVMLARASRALAFLRGQSFVLPDDVQHLIIPVLSHRLLSARDSILRHQDAEDLLSSIIERIEVPTEVQ